MRHHASISATYTLGCEYHQKNGCISQKSDRSPHLDTNHVRAVNRKHWGSSHSVLCKDAVAAAMLLSLLRSCLGNYCVGGAQGREPGNGRIVVAEYNRKSGDQCGWDVVKTVEIPSTAYFTDYSGMAFRDNKVKGSKAPARLSASCRLTGLHAVS